MLLGGWRVSDRPMRCEAACCAARSGLVKRVSSLGCRATHCGSTACSFSRRPHSRMTTNNFGAARPLWIWREHRGRVRPGVGGRWEEGGRVGVARSEEHVSAGVTRGAPAADTTRRDDVSHAGSLDEYESKLRFVIKRSWAFVRGCRRWTPANASQGGVLF